MMIILKKQLRVSSKTFHNKFCNQIHSMISVRFGRLIIIFNTLKVAINRVSQISLFCFYRFVILPKLSIKSPECKSISSIS